MGEVVVRSTGSGTHANCRFEVVCERLPVLVLVKAGRYLFQHARDRLAQPTPDLSKGYRPSKRGDSVGATACCRHVREQCLCEFEVFYEECFLPLPLLLNPP